ncbi:MULTISPECIES: hypothetical protein [Bradyrhizobium]|jgi:hypothetical protein|uniref:hypothetical protein n=1 Tax=Bradyrhizobium TaxID=374 RepID=UPI0012FDA2B4|nr:hypothetical protein [Bradyrhizobium elkanii]WLA80138.1 hypothetical protein QNJ99_32820 [Bradyrhizobium elkanii]
MPTNLEMPRPDEWTGDLFEFIEDCWNNSIAVVGNNNVIAARMSAIDIIFHQVVQGLKPKQAELLVPVMLLLRSFSAFRAAVMIGLSLPAESFALQRSCLEHAGYAKLIATDIKLSRLWVQRDENLAEIRKQFTNRAVRDAIEKDDREVAKVYQELYERSIDFGAHPNEKAVLGSVVPGTLDTGNLMITMLGGESVQLYHSLRSCAQVGICSLKIFNLVFPAHFATHDFANKIVAASRSF